MPEIFMIIYFVAVISIVIYMIRLFIRLVKAVEKIANLVEGSCKSEASQTD